MGMSGLTRLLTGTSSGLLVGNVIINFRVLHKEGAGFLD